VLIIAFGCATGEERQVKEPEDATTSPQAGIDQTLLGEWVTAATSAGHYDGVLQLSADGTFREEDKFRSDGSVQKVEGRFTFSASPSGEAVVLTVEKLDGNPVSGGPPIELSFDRKAQTLTNPFPGVVYVRRTNGGRISGGR
jgi:hypothetical protein